MHPLPRTNDEWLDLEQQYYMRHPLRTAPMVPERGEGLYMWDVEGNRYIDFQSGQLCVVLGHSHPRYVEAVCEQARTLMQTGTAFSVPSQILLAKKIAELMPDPLQKSIFACTGSESNEIALRLAKVYTGRFEVVSLTHGYHGQTYGSYSISGYGGAFRDGYGPGVPGVTFIPEANCYRCPLDHHYPECGIACAKYAEYVLDTTTSGKPAALFFEPLMSAGGMLVPAVEWVREIRRICTERGILMVADEALTGFGRTGKWFAFEHFGIVPDIVTQSKGLGGAVPLCAVTTSAEIADRAMERGFMTFSSHSGDPLLCAAGLANIEIIEQEGLVENARVVGDHLKAGLWRLQEQYDIVGDVRGLGLCLGLEIVTDPKSKTPFGAGVITISKYCFDHGLWLAGVGLPRKGDNQQDTVLRSFQPNIIRLMPPITLTIQQADEALEIIEGGIKAAQDEAPRPSAVSIQAAS
ncbi:MAG: aspartate aminotransferase family protein [Candidatus Latescibacteria bacterium]|nr:aspartate aminotransferase family protein [Candidatus Latescibacterota bacterium]